MALANPRALLSAVFLLSTIATAVTSQSPTPAGALQAEARVAYDILSRNCFRCHGANGAAMKNIFVLDRQRLVSSGVVVPSNPDSILLKMIETGTMPVGGPELSRDEKSALREWVLKGAPDWGPGEAGPASRPRLSESVILKLIQDDLLTALPRTRPFLRYFSLAHLYNAGVRDPELDTYRHALSKLLNSLSWKREIACRPPLTRLGPSIALICATIIGPSKRGTSSLPFIRTQSAPTNPGSLPSYQARSRHICGPIGSPPMHPYLPSTMTRSVFLARSRTWNDNWASMFAATS